MKFDMSAAWAEAVRLISANRQVVAIVAGVFFFLPAVIYGLAFTNQISAIQARHGAAPDFENTFKAMAAVVNDVWWVILLTIVVQWLGTLSLVVLWTDRSRPTVGEAIKTGVAYLLPLIGAQLLFAVVVGIALLLPVAIGAGGSQGGAVLAAFVSAGVIVYLFVKFSLLSPVVAIERINNPITALGRSWRLTKGNSLRLLAFFFLLFVAMIVVSSVVSLVFGLVLALAGAELAMVGQAIGSGLVSAVFSLFFLAALVAIYRQVTGSSERNAETFE